MICHYACHTTECTIAYTVCKYIKCSNKFFDCNNVNNYYGIYYYPVQSFSSTMKGFIESYWSHPHFHVFVAVLVVFLFLFCFVFFLSFCLFSQSVSPFLPTTFPCAKQYTCTVSNITRVHVSRSCHILVFLFSLLFPGSESFILQVYLCLVNGCNQALSLIHWTWDDALLYSSLWIFESYFVWDDLHEILHKSL